MTHKLFILSALFTLIACENPKPTENSPSTQTSDTTTTTTIPTDTFVGSESYLLPTSLKNYNLVYHTLDYEKVVNDEPTQELPGRAFVGLFDSIIQIISNDYNATFFVSKIYKDKQTISYNLVYKKSDINRNKRDALIFIEVEADSTTTTYIQFQSKDTIYSFHNCTSN